MIHRISKFILIYEVYRQIRGIIAYSIFFKILFLLIHSNYWEYCFKILVTISFIISIITLINQIKFFCWKFNKDKLVVKSGIFFKKKLTLTRNNIKGLQTITPWYFKPFKLCMLQIKLPSTGDSESIKFTVISKEELLEFQSWYTEKNDVLNQNQHKNLVNIRIKRLIISSIFTLNYFYLLTILNFLDKGLKYFGISLFDILFLHYKNIIFLTIIIISGILSSFIKQFLDYFYLDVFIDNRNINVGNGLLSSDYVKINLDDVIGFKISQNIGQRILGLWSLKVIVQNYNITGGVSKVTHLLPFSTIEEVKKFEKEIYGTNTFITEENLNYSNNYFQLIVLFLLFIASSISLIHFLVPILLLFIRIIVLYNRNYKENGTKLVFKNSFVTTSSTIVEKNNIEWKEVITLFSKIKYFKIAYAYNPVKVFKYIEKRNF